MNFREFILYGDVAREMEEDEGLQIHDDHRAAFKVCQFSAQYLDHCVESLSERLQEYSSQYRVLADTRTQLARKRRGLKEHDDLDLLVTTYQRVLEKNGGSGVPEVLDGPRTEKPQEVLGPSLPTSPPGSPSASLPSTKPVFLKTWEERERERRLEKELSKAQRIEEERQRLRQHVLERQEREDHEALVTRLVERRRQRAAQRIQAFFRTTTQHLRAARFAAISRGATTIQAIWKCFISVKQYPLRLEKHKQAREWKSMAENEREMRQWLAYQQQQQKEAWTQETDLLQLSQDSEPEQAACASSTSSPSKHVVDALVATWRKLHRVFVLAHTANGIDYRSLFSQLDLRKDDVLDRAELRLGVRSFGVRLDRKLTRALITLIRTKCGAPSKPLLVTFAQFVEGFELTSKEATLVNNRSTSESKPTHDIEDNSHESRSPEAVHSDMPADTGVAQGHDELSEEEALVLAVRTFREAIHQAAASHLKALGKSTTDYRAFREALTHVFQAFDVDNDGQLDLDELVACMASFGLQVSKENTSLIQQLFSDGQASDTISVTEFISFVLAHSSSTAEHHEDSDELGLQGFRMREVILTLVKQAQTQDESVEDAVRLVLRAAYKRKNQQHCSIRDFVRALGSLHLGLAPAQIARLVMRLDRDGDRSISLDELLVWLRLRPNVRSPPPHDALLPDSLRSSPSHTALLLAKAKAKVLRFVLSKIAEGDQPDGPIITPALTPANKKDKLTALFRRIDRNGSSQINQDELQTFLATQDLAKIRAMTAETAEEEILAALFGPSSLPQVPVARAAKEMMSFLDLNGNGVATLEEWLAFAQHDGMERDDDPAVIEAVRTALKASENQDPGRLLLWFSCLPGAMQVASSNPRESTQMKVRVGEFKAALRLKLGGAHLIPLRTIDQVVQSLDADGSGWITINELHTWAFPSRDLEEILRLVIKSWEEERQKLLQHDSIEAFATSLYHRFDTDGNGCLAVRELLSGFASFGVVLTEYEARVLMLAFDVDGDGCWDKTEFMAFASKLFPAERFIDRAPTATTPDRHEMHTSNDENHVPEHDGHPSNHDEYDDDDLLLLSGSAESSLLSSNASATSMRANESELGLRPVEYSEDFDLDE
ncbi:hypothetical protein BBJ28_00002090 [Nothophytophthora sp. Chile5]|nr:hypothetical protein BBJ28_00002090 [Nothophytophthora sp. Chile5]